MECRTSCRSEFIPLAMQNANRWTIWAPRLVEKNDGSTRWTKVPLDGKGGEADITDAKNLHGFKQTFIAAGLKSLGVGFVSGNGWAGIDIDHCIDENGEFSALASLILSECGSYAEKSPSGRGVRIFCKAKSAGYINRKNTALGLEIATDKKFFTVTGDALPGCKEINERSEFLLELLATYFPASESEPDKQTQGGGAPRPGPRAAKVSLGLSDTELLQKARNAKGREGTVFCALYDRGDIHGFSSHSEADMRLNGMFAFWSGRDADRMRRLWQSSALWREDKCEEREDYVMDTIQTAIANCRNTYDPAYNDFRELPTPTKRSARPEPTAAPKKDAENGGFSAPDVVNSPCKILSAEKNTTTDNDAAEDESLPEELPSPELSAGGTELDFPQWQKRGRALKRWKERLDNTYRWALGDWWNSARKDIAYGDKSAFLKKLFGSVQARNVENYAPVCARITDPEERQKVPSWWVYRELGNVETEKREEVYRTYHEKMKEAREERGKALNSKDLRTMLGIPEANPAATKQEWWQLLRDDPQGKKLGKKLWETLHRAQLGDPNDAQTIEYVTQALQGRLWEENAPANFHPSVKIETPENADFEKETPPVSAYENDTVFAQEEDDSSAQAEEEFSLQNEDPAEPDSAVSSSPPSSVLINTDTPIWGEGEDNLAQWREEVKQEWAQSVQRGDMAALTSSLLSCIWQREVTLPARDAFQRATADELGRLVYYLDHGEALQPSADGAQYLPEGGAQA